MPYFKNDEKGVNLLFIHIPKTGGTSVETYFSDKYSIPLDEPSLMSTKCLSMFTDGYDNNKYNQPVMQLPENQIMHFHSLQHCTYQELLMYKDRFNINFDNDSTKINIISIVRNPYTRILSDLFYFHLIDVDTPSDQVCNIVCRYLNNKESYINGHVFDRHNMPQYLYLVDKTGSLSQNIKILRTETLDDDMKSLGYSDFNYRLYVSRMNEIDYSNLLNADTIELINESYKKDFEYFNYKML